MRSMKNVTANRENATADGNLSLQSPFELKCKKLNCMCHFCFCFSKKGGQRLEKCMKKINNFVTAEHFISQVIIKLLLLIIKLNAI